MIPDPVSTWTRGERRYDRNNNNKTMRLLSLFFPLLIMTITTSSSFALRRNIRWALRGVAAEMIYNVFRRSSLPIPQASNEQDATQSRKELAIVTGATGGIGTEIAKGLVARNYEVLVLARNVAKGQALAQSMEGASFVEYHADQISSLQNVQDAIGERPVAVVINNAGVMGGSKHDTLQINLVAPTLLTVSLLSALKKQQEQSTSTSLSSSRPPMVINVSSSSHLRAAQVVQYPPSSNGEDQDSNLAAYAESKLGLMQVSTLLRHSLPWLSVIDAHPGLVWTPLLQSHFPAAKLFERIGLHKLLYKMPPEGAATILAALDHGYQPPATHPKPQVYYVNGQPGGYASVESNNLESSLQLWNEWLGPAVQEADGFDEVQEGLRIGENQKETVKEKEEL